jgi:hypothetical protein
MQNIILSDQCEQNLHIPFHNQLVVMLFPHVTGKRLLRPVY